MSEGTPDAAGQLSLAERIVETPQLAEPEAARERVEQWASEPPVSAPLRVHLHKPGVRELLTAIADHSPYLWRLATQDPERLTRILSQPPRLTLDQCLDDLGRCCQGASAAEAEAPLRRAKAEVALLVALADLGGAWPFEAVVEALTRFADAAVPAAIRCLLRDAERAGKFRAAGPDLEAGCGLVVLALGKAGSRELNYSSDIDLVVLYDPHASALAEGVAPAPFFVRLTQGLVRLLSDRTPDGYVLRVDLRLRPDPGSTAVALSLSGAFSYYEMLGQNWERAAFIKARPIAGDLRLGEHFLSDLAPFIWRRYFDYAAIADIHAMKRQIHAVRGFADVAVVGHDVKLGRGGIREIEFFVQTQQLIFGGRRPRLRGPRTLEMLVALREDGWVGADAVEELSAAYRFLRRIEHRLQMVADEQTQRLPSEPKDVARFGRFAGYRTGEAFAAEMLFHMRAVEKHYARLFEHAPGLDVDAGNLVFTGVSVDPETVETLRKLGFARPEEAVETVRGWHFGRRAAVRSARAREVLTELVPALLAAFSGSGDPDAALAAFDSALARMPAAAELLAILRSNQALRELFADILGMAPRLAASVVAHPHLLDTAIDPSAIGGSSGSVEARLSGLGVDLPTEEFLDRAREAAQEEMFLIGVRLLAGADDPAEAGKRFADLAQGIIRAAFTHVRAAFSKDHGEVPGSRCVVVAMGRLGSREMTATSDLDLLVIYDFDPRRADSDGMRSLDATRYYTRLTQRLIAALTVPTRRGRLYQVDMRLRPSGNQGPLATQLRGFVDYQAHEAANWEHMALTRGRVVAGDPSLAAEVEAVIGHTLARRRGADLGTSIAGLRALVAREKGDADPWNLKLASGGLLDIEFVAQFLVLRHASAYPSLLRPGTADILEQAVRRGVVPPDVGEALLGAHRLYTGVTQLLRLATEEPFDPAKAGSGLKRRLVAIANYPDFSTLERALDETRALVRSAFGTIIGSA